MISSFVITFMILYHVINYVTMINILLESSIISGFSNYIDTIVL